MNGTFTLQGAPVGSYSLSSYYQCKLMIETLTHSYLFSCMVTLSHHHALWRASLSRYNALVQGSRGDWVEVNDTDGTLLGDEYSGETMFVNGREWDE